MREIHVTIPAIESLPFAFPLTGDWYDEEVKTIDALEWTVRVSGGEVRIGDGLVGDLYPATAGIAGDLLERGKATIEGCCGETIGWITVV